MSKNIYQRIQAVMQDVKYVQKTGWNGFNKYKYAKESDYIESLRPSMLKHGLVILPVSQKVSQVGELSTVEMEFKVVNVDNPEEFLIVPSVGQGSDKSDKGAYKSITGAKKYMLSLLFLVETGDDAEEDDKDFKDAKEAEAPAKPDSAPAPTPTLVASESNGLPASDSTVRKVTFRKVGQAPLASSKPAQTTSNDLDL